ncbi:hypothetical protein P8452_61442 [Trifolium repens]|nr:hypothetical protein P8452_61442 [Trifolium repens]
MARKKTLVASKKRKRRKTQLLDLPNQTIDCILERLSPEELCRVSETCTYLKNQCSSDYLWKKHVQQKWSNLIGDVVHQVWQWHRTKIKYATSFSLHKDVMDTCATFRGTWPFVGIQSYLENHWPYINLVKNYSQKALYTCIETGCFWFPAQLYRNPMYMISYCDAMLCYDSRTYSFQARSPLGDWKITETRVKWHVVRLSAPNTFVRGYYKSICLSYLEPGDYIEIQTRPNVLSPYDWSFAEVGHLESCDKDAHNCTCKHSDTLVVEFKHLPGRSLNRKSLLKRNIFKEQRYINYYFGGIKKPNDEEEITKWKSFFPNHKLPKLK